MTSASIVSTVEQGICYFIDFSYIIVCRVIGIWFLINGNAYFWLNFSL